MAQHQHVGRERQVAKHEHLSERASKGGQATKRKWERKTKAYGKAIAIASSLPTSVQRERERERLSIESALRRPLALEGATFATAGTVCVQCDGRRGLHAPECPQQSAVSVGGSQSLSGEQ
jgi:hypothetical protein